MSHLPGWTACLALLLAPGTARAAPDCIADAMLVFDGSGSMSEIGFDASAATRIEEARIAVARALPEIAELRRVGLVVYGAGADSCATDLRLPPTLDAAAPIIAAVDGLRPGGLTPLAQAVEMAATALDYRREPGIVVVVTDGNETCGGRPCTLGAQLAAEAQDLTIHVIGFRVEVDFWTWDNPEQESYANDRSVARCLAERTGGQFVTTETVDELVEALRETLGCPVIGALTSSLSRRPL
ncbi:VWA domain-containing protein [Pseudooceanicola sp. LIPI14-2-Ac024]|uniref:vWA domain-containing protein n=1 Tax=Pseudooceanicola sp. LIPI14-2-Ac024 TaxID=3344875 RepID=UPI0035CF95D2